jgi:hypothetical protein
MPRHLTTRCSRRLGDDRIRIEVDHFPVDLTRDQFLQFAAQVLRVLQALEKEATR